MFSPTWDCSSKKRRRTDSSVADAEEESDSLAPATQPPSKKGKMRATRCKEQMSEFSDKSQSISKEVCLPRTAVSAEDVFHPDPETRTSDREALDSTENTGEVIDVKDFDFVTMKNLLYFLHTGQVNLHRNTENSLGLTHPAGYPDPVDAFSMYRAANMYLVPALEDRCYRYLRSTCSPKNVCDRLLGNPDCNYYPKLRRSYFNYLVRNFDAVKTTKAWKKLHRNLKRQSPELVAYQSKLLFKISSRTSTIKPPAEDNSASSKDTEESDDSEESPNSEEEDSADSESSEEGDSDDSE